MVEQWILDLADKWFYDYLRETARQNGFTDPEYFPDLTDYGVTNEYEKWPEEHLPYLLAMYMGYSDRTMRQGDGSYTVSCLFGASIIVSTPTKRDTRIATAIYGAAFQAMILQHKSLEHPERIVGLSWNDGRPANIPAESARSLGAHMMFFDIDVKDVVTEGGTPPNDEPSSGPYVPPDPPPVVRPVDPDNPTTPRGGVRIDIVKEMQP
jgi:hypothetical protein